MCQQWLNSHPYGTGTVPTGWCDDMGHWMTSQINGHHMTGVAIWGTPQTLTTTCRNLAKTQPAGATQWCGRMVAWMSGHVGTWNDWQHWTDHMRVGLMSSVCRQWLNSHPTGTGTVPTGWCDDVRNWMTNQINGHHMTGVAIFGTPQTFTTTCRNWAKTQPTGATQWCGRMVAWMSGHVGTWNDWQHWTDHMRGCCGDGNTGTTYPYNHMGGGPNGNTGTTYPGDHHNGNTGTTYPYNHMGGGPNGNTGTTYPGDHHNGNTGTTYPYNHMGGGPNGNTGTTYPGDHHMM